MITRKIEPEHPFSEPWHERVFALTQKLAAKGDFTWAEWNTRFAEQRAKSVMMKSIDLDAVYYEDWLKAFERLMVDKGLADAKSLAHLRSVWKLPRRDSALEAC